MKIKFWGVRGSIASPGPKTVRYGGNTTCVELRTDDNHLVILDADPLASARNYRRIASVIKDGKVVDLATLPEKPIVSAKRVAK